MADRFVFVIIEQGSRRVDYCGVTTSPTDAWLAQQLREATPFAQGPRYLHSGQRQQIWQVVREGSFRDRD